VGLAVFKTVAGQPALSRVGSTPTHSRQFSKLEAADSWGSTKPQPVSEADRFPATLIAECSNAGEVRQDFTIFHD